MKYKDGNYYQKSKRAFEILREAHASASTCHLYDVLCFDEHKYTDGITQDFYRSIKDLCEDSGLSSKTVMKALKTLKDLTLIRTWQEYRHDDETGQKKRNRITNIMLLD